MSLVFFGAPNVGYVTITAIVPPHAAPAVVRHWALYPPSAVQLRGTFTMRCATA